MNHLLIYFNEMHAITLNKYSKEDYFIVPYYSYWASSMSGFHYVISGKDSVFKKQISIVEYEK